MLRNLLLHRKNWEDIAVIEHGRNVSYGELARKAFALRQLLPSQPNENIAIFLPNGSEYIAALFAVITPGMTAFPLHASMTQHEAVPLLRQVGVRVIITSERFRALFDGVPGLRIVTVEQAHAAECIDTPAAEPNPDAPAVLLGTSGTTGKSKIVMLSERNIDASFLGYVDKMGFGEFDRLRFILATPFSSSYGIMILSACLMKSFPLVLIDEPFTLDMLYKTASEHQVTNYEGGALPIQMMEFFYDRPIPYDVSRFTCFGFGGSKVPGHVIDRVMALYPGLQFFQGYGMTEAAPLITKHKRGPLTKTDSVGAAIKGVEIAIEADGVISQTPYAEGEILVKGPNIMLGYYENEAETEAILKNGYLHTGDIGYLDEEAFLYICGRKKNILIVRGLNVYPEEVEACILENRLVEDCLVYGRTDEAGNELVCADVLPASPQVAAADIRAWCAARLAGYKQPREIHLCDAIQKNATGKTPRLTQPDRETHR